MGLLDSIINAPSSFAAGHHLGDGTTLIVVLTGSLLELAIGWAFILGLVRLVQYRFAVLGLWLRHFDKTSRLPAKVFLELTFAADTARSAFATEQLHILLSHQTGPSDPWQKRARHKSASAMEIYATHDSGIRYIMAINQTEVDFVEHSLRSYMPGLKIKRVPDYLSLADKQLASVIELGLSADYALPLKEHKALSEHDYIAYLIGQMTKLGSNELIGFQIVVTPVFNETHTRVTRHVDDLQQRLARSQLISNRLYTPPDDQNLYRWQLLFGARWLLSVMRSIATGFVYICLMLFSRNHPGPRFMDQSRNKLPADNPYEQELSQAIKTKLDQPLYEVALRLLVAGDDQAQIYSKLDSLLASFKPFNTPNQALVINTSRSFIKLEDKLLGLYKNRSLSLHFTDLQTIVSSSELSDLYHFPDTSLTKAEGLVKSRSAELPVPLSIRRSDAKLDVIVGVNRYAGQEQSIGLTLSQRQKHAYVIGKTGMGKTTMLTSMIYQDMLSGKGLAVLDPHGDMFRELLRIVPEHRHKDVVVFDPSDRQWPSGLNILDPGIEFDSEDERREWISSSVVHIFQKLAGDKYWGAKMENNLRHAVLTALELPNPTLYTIQRLLTEKGYQRSVAKDLEDPVLKQFWQKEFKLMGGMQLSSAVSPLTHRTGRFITDKLSRHILLQQKSTLRISDIMNEGKILLVNLAKGDIGEDQSFFFGTLLTSLIWMSAFQRTKIPEKQRRDFFVYVDEFQNFATKQFTDITSEGRKFHVGLIASHQNIAQIEDKSILKIVAGNADSIMCLKASPDDEAFILPYMKPEVKKGDIVNLAPYHFYMKTLSSESEDAFSGETVPLVIDGSDETAQAVILESRKQYAVPLKEVEINMHQLFGTVNIAQATKGTVANDSATDNMGRQLTGT